MKKIKKIKKIILLSIIIVSLSVVILPVTVSILNESGINLRKCVRFFIRNN